MYSCSVCEKPFSFKSSLDRHQREIHLKRTHSCESCGKVFKRNDTLKIHELSGRCLPKRITGKNDVGDIFGKAHAYRIENYESEKESVGENDDDDDDLGDIESPIKMQSDCVDENSPGQFFVKERSPLDIAMHSVMSNQELDTRNKLRGYFKVVGDHLRCKRLDCLQSKLDIDEKSNYSEEDEDQYYEDDDPEDDDESRIESNKEDSSDEDHQSGNGANRNIFGGSLVNSMECDASGEESNCDADDELEDTDVDSNEDNFVTETEESDEITGDTLESADDDINEDSVSSDIEDDIYEEVFINWPDYNVKKPWHSYGKEIVLFDQLPWLQSVAASQSTLLLMKDIRHGEEPQILALCEIALNLLMDHIPMTVEDFNCYKSQKDNLRELAYGDNNWKRNRLLLGSNNILVWILLVSIEPLYAEVEELEKPKLKRKTISPVQTRGWKKYKAE